MSGANETLNCLLITQCHRHHLLFIDFLLEDPAARAFSVQGQLFRFGYWGGAPAVLTTLSGSAESIDCRI